MTQQVLSWTMVIIGLIGFHYAGKKRWWAWYINIACQILWFAYGILSHQWAFLFSAGFYTSVFTKNAIAWTREHNREMRMRDEEIKESYLDECPECGHPRYAHTSYCVWVKDLEKRTHCTCTNWLWKV